MNVPVLDAGGNYWGASSGAGADPADTACNEQAGTTTTTTPFALAPFPVSAPIKP